jgi:hypothetical protein
MQHENTASEDELGRELDEGAPNACNDSEFPGLDQLTAEAQAAMTKLGANDAEHIRLALDFGSFIAKAKEKLAQAAGRLPLNRLRPRHPERPPVKFL